jgi:Xaa-Pro aminopeptidase
MDTLHTVLNRGCSVWDKSRIPLNEFQQRLAQVREGMRGRGVDLLLVYGDSWRFGHLAFVSHFMPKNRGALAVIPLEGEPALIVQEPDRNNPFSRSLTWMNDVHSVGQFARGLGEVIKARELKPKVVGLVSVEEQLGVRQWTELFNGLDGIKRVDCGEILDSLRLVKNSHEETLLRQSCGILQEALSLLKSELRAGQRENEVMALVEHAARRRGVEDFRFLIARSSQPDMGLRPAGSAILATGEAILVVMVASYQRYWVELGQTLCLGRASQEVVSGYKSASALFRRFAEGLTAGADAQFTNRCLEESGASAAERSSVIAYGAGNGIGLDLVEKPILGVDRGVTIKDGMVLTLRVCLQGRQSGSALISRPYRVTSRGLESLVREGEELVTVAA